MNSLGNHQKGIEETQHQSATEHAENEMKQRNQEPSASLFTSPSQEVTPTPTLFSSSLYIPDSEGEDSDDEFGELDRILEDPKPQSPKMPKDVVIETRTRSRPTLGPSTSKLSSIASTTRLTRLNNSPPKKDQYEAPTADFSLDWIRAQKRNNAARKLEYEKAEKLMKEADEEQNKPDREDGRASFDGEVLKIAAKGDDDAASVLAQQLGVTDLWRLDRRWSFFASSICFKAKQVLFPRHLSGDSPWLNDLTSPDTRDDLFVSGFLADMAGTLSIDLLRDIIDWLLEQICFEKMEDLSYSYYRTLEALVPYMSSLESETIARLFQNLGATPQALEIRIPIRIEQLASPKSKVSMRLPNLWNISLVLKFIAGSCASLSIDAAVTAFCLILRLAQDHRVYKTGQLITEIEKALSKIMQVCDDNTWSTIACEISDVVMRSYTVSVLQLRLLNVLPLAYARGHLFRRRLALAFFFNNSSYVRSSTVERVNIRHFILALSRPEFQICSGTDFVHIEETVNIMDIAIDDGSAMIASQQFPEAFDNDIKILTTRLNAIDSKIFDGAAMDLTRSDAKAALERLHSRLKNTLGLRRTAKQSMLDSHFGYEDNMKDGSRGEWRNSETMR